MMRQLLFALSLLALGSTTNTLVYSQSREPQSKEKPAPKMPVNPFDVAAQQMADEYGEDMWGMEEGTDMDMGMGGGMDMGGAAPAERETQQFRRGLEIAITMLRKESDQQKRKILQAHIRKAFDARYTKMLNDRKKDIERLQASVQKLESDLKRRENAKTRVIDLQMQSVQLAAEGILELQDIRPKPGGYAPPPSGFGN